MGDDRRVYIKDLAERPGVDRRVGTIRKWEREGRLPTSLLPKRDERGWRYWTEEQAGKVEEWMVRADIRPGKGLPHNAVRPDDRTIKDHLEKLRQPRKTRGG